MPEASLSHNPVSVQNAPQRNHKRVHFAPNTTDIITTLNSRAEFSFSTSCSTEQYTPQDVELYVSCHCIWADYRFENAAQVIGIIFSNHRFLERLDVLDVQTLVLEIITRVDLHIDSKLLPDVFHSRKRLIAETIPKSHLAIRA